MAKNELKRIMRPATAEERERHAEIRAKVVEEFPPVQGCGKNDSPPACLPRSVPFEKPKA